MTLTELKHVSAASSYVSVLGKSTIDSASAEYKFIVDATKVALEAGFGVIHGGYAGGAMSAASDTAAAHIQAHGLPAERNIGVPQAQHDSIWARVENAVFTNTADDIFDRLRDVTAGDFAIVAPLGGDGTELEVAVIQHENLIRYTQPKTSKGRKPTPIIFLQTAGGTNWKSLMQSKAAYLTTKTFTSVDECPWMFFVNSMEEFTQAFNVAKTQI